MRISIIVIKFIFVGALLIIANNNLHLNVPAERDVFYTHLYSWFDNLYQKSLGIAGYVVKSEWLPQDANIPSVDDPKIG